MEIGLRFLEEDAYIKREAEWKLRIWRKIPFLLSLFWLWQQWQSS